MSSRIIALASLTALLLVLGGGAAAGDPAPAATIRVAGLRVLDELPHERGLPQIRWLSGEQPGTTVIVRIDHAQGLLLSLSDKSVLAQMTDDRGNDLAAGGKGSRTLQILGQPRFSKDRHVALLSFYAPRLPAKGAAAIRAKGTLVFRAGSKQVTQQSEPGSAKTGTRFVLPSATYTVKQVGAAWGAYPLTLTLHSPVEEPEVQAVRFLDADGQAIASKAIGRGRNMVKGVYQTTRRFALKTKPAQIRVEIDVLDPIREMAIPFDLNVRVGL